MVGDVTTFMTFLENFRHDLRMYRITLVIKLRAALVFRASFVTQSFYMILNDFLFLTAWLFFFHFFGSINGWGPQEYIGLQGIFTLVYGLVMLCSSGLSDLPRHVDQGSLDSILSKPSSVLMQLAGSGADSAGIYSIISSFPFIIWCFVHSGITMLGFAFFVIALVVACAIFWCFTFLLPGLLAFYVFDSEYVVRSFGELFEETIESGTGVLAGVLRIILITFIPGLLVAAVPLDVARGLHWRLFVFSAVVTTFWLALGLWLFRRSLRRYESGNLIGAR